MQDNDAENLLDSLLSMTESQVHGLGQGLAQGLAGLNSEDMSSFQLMCTVCYQLSNEGCHCHQIWCDR